MAEKKEYPIGNSIQNRLNEIIKKKKRTEKGFSQEKFYQDLGMGKTGFYKIKNGQTKDPSLETVLNMASILDVSIAYLTEEIPYERPDTDTALLIMEELGFDNEMIENLQAVKKNQPEKWEVCKSGLQVLLKAVNEDTSELPLLFSIGKYFNALPDTGKMVVYSDNINDIFATVDNDNIRIEEIKDLIADMSKYTSEYPTEIVEGYWLQRINYELQKAREKHTENMAETIKALSLLSEEDIQQQFMKYIKDNNIDLGDKKVTFKKK